MIHYPPEFVRLWKQHDKTQNKWWLQGPAGWTSAIRENDNGQIFADNTYPPADVECDDIHGSPVPMCAYYPRGDSWKRFIFYIHGGGWVFGDRTSEISIVTRLAATTKSVVFTASYRLAPEDKHPAAFDDCMAVIHWILEEGSAGYTVQSKKLTIAGTSSGATLTASLSMMEEFVGQILGQILIAPVLDNTVEGQKCWNKDAIDLTPEKLSCYQELVFGSLDRMDPQISPGCAEDEKLRRSPPTLILIPGNCIAGYSGVRFDEALKRCLVKVEKVLLEDMPHVILMERLLGLDLTNPIKDFLDDIEPG